MSNLNVFLDKYQLAARYGRSHHTITSWRKRRLLPCTRVGYRTILFPVAACDQALEKLTRLPR